jgi:glucokinase
MREVSYAIGVDIGGRKINIGLADRSGKLVDDITMPTLAKEQEVVNRAIQGIEQILTRPAIAPLSKHIQGIGVGTTGQVDYYNGTVLSATDMIPGYAGTEIKKILETRFQMPVIVDNDVNVMALYEKNYGAAKKVNHLVCFALGTGVGGAVLSDGKMLRGRLGAAGELGHCSVNFNGPKCSCGNTGCLELYASGSGLTRNMNNRLCESGSRKIADAREVFQRYALKDRIAIEVIEEMLEALSTAIANSIYTFNPEMIVIGGGVADSLEPLLPGLTVKVKSKTMSALCDRVEIVLAAKGNKSSMLGAAALIWENK